jgi:hypothetical protein
MATKLVEMAVHDPKTKKLATEPVEVQTVRVNIRNRDRYSAGRIFSDLCLDELVLFKPGQVKTLEISQALATELKKRKDRVWELTSAAPSPPEDEDEEEEMEAEEEQSEDDEPVKPQRVQRRRA